MIDRHLLCSARQRPRHVNRRGLHHGGQWIGLSSLLYLLADENAGIFITANHGSGIYTQYPIVEALLDDYFPSDGLTISQDASETGAANGTYRWNRIDRHTFIQLPSMITGITLSIEKHDDDVISTLMSPELIPDRTWHEVEPGLYQEADGTNRLGIDFDDNGEATAAHLAWPLLMTMDRLEWYESANLHIALLILFLVTLLTTAIWPVRRLYRRVRRRTVEYSLDHSRTRLLAGAIAGLIFAFLIGTLLMEAIDTVWFSQIPTLFKVWLVLPIIAAALTIPLAVYVIRLWMRNKADSTRRIHLTVIALAMIAFVPYLWYWGVLGFNY